MHEVVGLRNFVLSEYGPRVIHICDGCFFCGQCFHICLIPVLVSASDTVGAVDHHNCRDEQRQQEYQVVAKRVENRGLQNGFPVVGGSDER